MHRFEDTVVIEGRSPQEVFDYVADPDHGSEWISAAKEVRAEGEPGVGRKLIAKAGLLGVSFDMESTVTSYEPASRYGWASEKPFHTAFDFEFDEHPDGTEVHAAVEVDPGKFLPVGGKLVARKLKKQFDNDVATLKKNLER